MHPIKSVRLIFLLALLAALPSGKADLIAEMEGVHWTNGPYPYTYTLRLFQDPFWQTVDIVGISIGPMAGTPLCSGDAAATHDLLIQFSKVNQCINLQWNPDLTYAIGPPYTIRVRTTYDTYKVDDRGLFFFMNLVREPWVPGDWSPNAVGYAFIPCLVPCLPGEADNSPPTNISRLKLIPDVTIDQLIVSNNLPVGLNFHWLSGNTNGAKYLLQGGDLKGWTNITEIVGTCGDNTWLANAPFGDKGPFYRLQLETTSMQQRTASTVSFPASEKVEIVKVTHDRDWVHVTFKAKPGSTYSVRHFGLHDGLQEKFEIKATQTNETFRLKAYAVGGFEILPQP